MFKRNHEISLHRVHDTVTFRECDDKLTLRVYGDANRMTAGLLHVRRKMKDLTEESPLEEQLDAAREMATVIFGEEQADKLMEFYHNDPPGVLNVCLQYFQQRLTKKLVKAQKRDGV